MKLRKYDLPFDQYSRQMQVLYIINSLRKRDQKFTILDVGGYRGATEYLHKLDEVTVLDVFDVNDKNYIKGDATNMSISNNRYDFVVSFDVFEHISKDKRESFVKEMCRVAKRGVIVAAPVKTNKSKQAERSVNDYFISLHSKDHEWLYEHIKYGIPEAGQAARIMRGELMSIIVLPSNDIDLWVQMQGAIFTVSKHAHLHTQLKDLNRFYNQKIGPFDGSKKLEQSYRHIVVGLKDHRDLKLIEDRIEKEGYLDESKKIIVQNEITRFYEKSIDAQSKEIEELSTKAMGYEHACNELNKEIDRLRRELETIMSSNTFKVVKRTVDIKHKVVRKRSSKDI